MTNTIVFSKLQKGSIYGTDFQNMRENNEIAFSSSGIAVIYGPNGAGKTTLAKILSSEPGTQFELTYKGKMVNTSSNSLFHLISDQLGRNIISGSPREYFLGENIKREFELKDKIDIAFGKIFDQLLVQVINNRFKISTKSNPLVKCIQNETVRAYVEALVNKQDKGKSIDKKVFLEFLKSLKKMNTAEYSEENLQLVLSDYGKNRDSVIKKILEIDESNVRKDHDFRKLEENDDAINLLEKYAYLQECVVCDTEIDPCSLLGRKKSHKETFFQALDESTRKILEDIVQKLIGPDPLKIRETFLLAIKDGNKAPLTQLKKDIQGYLDLMSIEVYNLFASCTSESDIIELTDEYQTILASKPEIKEEDLSFIEQIVNENIERTIHIKRDPNSNLKVYIDDKELLGVDRDQLLLSTGEQNFISLSFELLKARNSLDKIIIIDDPISSFDSIYKNKIAFSLIKVLAGKQQIILTHNTDLIRLLEHQKPGCFHFYLLNKTLGEVNGFISIGKREIDILLHIDKLLDLLRDPIGLEIVEREYFWLSMIPFMRGYAHIVAKKVEYESLTSVMHGYNDERVDIASVYWNLFGAPFAHGKSFLISAKEIAESAVSNREIVNRSNYPLLDRTLNHSLSYLYLRLNVEKALTEKYTIDTTKKKMLSDIIFDAFKGDTPESVKQRVFLTSKKTLLNEFNHFEGNMNIFQPAIDITNSALELERESILKFVTDL